MAMDGLPGDVDVRTPRLLNHSRLQRYALSLVGALQLAAWSGGRPAFDCLFDRGFDRMYAWAYRLSERNPERALAFTSEVFLSAARALARRVAEAGVTSVRERTH